MTRKRKSVIDHAIKGITAETSGKSKTERCDLLVEIAKAIGFEDAKLFWSGGGGEDMRGLNIGLGETVVLRTFIDVNGFEATFAYDDHAEADAASKRGRP
jgi:hypothetical protein